MTRLPEAHWPPVAVGPEGIQRVDWFFSVRPDDLAATMRHRPTEDRDVIVACWSCDVRQVLARPNNDLALCRPCYKELIPDGDP